MAVTDKISTLVKNQFPDFYKEDGENFLLFIQAYYEYLEQTGKLTDGISNLQSYKDIDTTLDEYVEYFRKDLLPSIPNDTLADKRLLAKAIKFFNETRGTEASYHLLFRSLYNEDVDGVYPADQMLKVSDGDWRIDRYLIVPYDSNTFNFIGKTIKGNDSNAEALVEDCVVRTIRGRKLMQVLISNVKGTFVHLEPIRLKSDISSTGHAPIAEAGINSVTIVSPGAQYQVGDVVDLLSDDTGKFAKVVVTKIDNLGGTITFNLLDGGSGYTSSTQGSTNITISGGDGINADFVITPSDLGDTFAVARNTNLVTSNNIFGELAPIISGYGRTDTFANTPLSSPNYGFPESGEIVTSGTDFHDHANAVIVIANTSDPSISVGDSLFGVTTGANAKVNFIKRAYNSTDIVLDINGYKNFSSSEKVNIETSDGTTVGTVSTFSGNTVGHHVLQIGWIANTSLSPLTEGTELVGRTSGAFGVVKSVALVANGYTRGVGGADDRDLYTVNVTSNTTANLSSQYDTGPMRSFLSNEGLRIVGANTTVGNVVSTTSNTTVENIYTKLSDSLLFKATTIGTIDQLSLKVGGTGYTVAPTISVVDSDISALGIGEAYITLQSDDVNWGTGNSAFTKLDTNDKVVQPSTGVTSHVKGGAIPNQGINVSQYANGTYEMTVRVWQDELQRSPGNINWANNATAHFEIYDSSYTQGMGSDTRSKITTGGAIGNGQVVFVRDEGVLGNNARINGTVGANGVISALRVLDSGFSYKDNETVTVESTDRVNASSAEVTLDLEGVANAEGYYATTRSHISSLRGYLQDSDYYQEYAYEVVSGISLDRYRDVVLKLVHPAGQALFGRYRSQANVRVEVSATTSNKKRLQGNGSISINNGSYDLTGSSTTFTNEFANNGTVIIEYAHGEFYSIPLNIVSSDTAANVNIAWANSNLSGANVYYESGSI